MNKRASKNWNGNFWAFLPTGKKGMEMWVLILLIITAVFLIFMLIWYTGLGKSIAKILKDIGGLL